jgi:hypothetical protein
MRAFVMGLAILLLAGCASVKSTMLSDNTALVSAFGKRPTDRERVLQDALSEGAKITRVHGYRYFVVLMAADASRAGMVPVPGARFDIQNSHDRPLGDTNFSAPNYSGAVYTAPDAGVSYLRPGVDITIRMYREGEIDPKKDGVWSASDSR